MNINIRLEKPEDARTVEALTREAFWNVHVPGCDEHLLVHILRDDATFIPALNFIAEVDGQLAGSIYYTTCYIEGTDDTRHEVILFGPVSVLPAWQGKGVGGALIRHSADAARRLGYTAILIYGDPLYYTRFGFRPASDWGIVPPDGQPHPALQALELVPGALDGKAGRFFEPEIYERLTPEAVEAFDASFPPKAKGFAESQRRFAQLSGRGDV